ncbi:MAG: SurA N-terminal domain-containing protein [Patescibacteria group bacterium]
MTTSSKIGLSVIIIALLVALGWVVYNNFGDELISPEFDSTDNSEVVAVVNGENITQNELEQGMEQMRSMIEAYSPDQALSEEELKETVLDELISGVLLYQEAKNQGLELDQAEVEAEYEAMLEQQGEEQLTELMAEAGLSTEELKEEISRNLTINAYINYLGEQEGIEVTEAEVEEMYEQLTEGQEEAPALEEVAEEVRSQLLQEKSNLLISEMLEELKNNAEIEIL